MPGPTPVLATHRLHIPLVVDGLAHNQHFYCDAELVAGTMYFKNVDGGTHLAANTAMEQMAVYLREFWAAANSSWGDWVVEENIGGSYVPVWFHTNSLNPNGGGSYGVASQLTFVFRDVSFHKMRLPFMETRYLNPLHFTNVLSGDAVFDAFIGDVLDRSDDTHIGYWLESRAAVAIGSFVSATATDNRRIRRDRGVI